MKQYNEVSIEIILIQTADIVRTSPGGVEYNKDPNDSDKDLGWGA